MDIRGLVESLVQSNGFARVVNDPLAQFGPPNRSYLGAELLPEKQVPENEYTEQAIRYRTVLANDGTRFSPVQLKGNVLSGSMRVSLGHNDIGSQFTGPDYDALIRLIEQSTGTAGVVGGGVDRPTEMAMAQMVNWADMTLNRPLLELIEYQRWQALVNASVVRVGDDGYRETVAYPNPTGHRVNAGGTWSSDAYDPYADIISMVEFLADKGFIVNRIVTGTGVRSILALNAKMKARVGKVIINTSGNAVNQAPGRATVSDMDNIFGADGLPGIQLYDRQYRTQTTTGYFLPRGVMAFFCTTGRDQSIDRGDLEPLTIQDTLGYVGIGRAAGASAPGRKVVVTPFDNKPPRVQGEAWQTSLPVPQEPEAIGIISAIA